jgi:hypothetical protein
MEDVMVSSKVTAGAIALVLAATLAGCASQSGPQQIGFTGGGDCKTVRGELNRLDAQGVPGKVEARAAGRKVSADANAQIERYNGLLQEYLGNQCQLPPA